MQQKVDGLVPKEEEISIMLNMFYYPRLNYSAEHVPASTGSTERSFSVQNSIQTKQRNRMRSEKLDKCAFVKINVNVFRPKERNPEGNFSFFLMMTVIKIYFVFCIFIILQLKFRHQFLIHFLL